MMCEYQRKCLADSDIDYILNNLIFPVLLPNKDKMITEDQLTFYVLKYLHMT